MRAFWIIIALLLVLGPVAQPAAAQRRTPPRGPATVLDRLERMTPEERRRVLEDLPPERRKRLEQRLEQYESLPPQQRERMRRQLSRFRQLSPERQEQTRQLFRRFNQLPENRRREVRRAVRQFGQLDEKRRKARMESPGFRSRFSPEERQMVLDLLEVQAGAEPPGR